MGIESPAVVLGLGDCDQCKRLGKRVEIVTPSSLLIPGF
jgi:hypothetical protein